MSQVIALLLLAPAIQADILLGRIAATEGGLRSACALVDWIEQIAYHERRTLTAVSQ